MTAACSRPHTTTPPNSPTSHHRSRAAAQAMPAMPRTVSVWGHSAVRRDAPHRGGEAEHGGAEQRVALREVDAQREEHQRDGRRREQRRGQRTRGVGGAGRAEEPVAGQARATTPGDRPMTVWPFAASRTHTSRNGWVSMSGQDEALDPRHARRRDAPRRDVGGPHVEADDASRCVAAYTRNARRAPRTRLRAHGSAASDVRRRARRGSRRGGSGRARPSLSSSPLKASGDRRIPGCRISLFGSVARASSLDSELPDAAAHEVPMKLVVQIPCLNEEETLPSVLRSIPRQIRGDRRDRRRGHRRRLHRPDRRGGALARGDPLRAPRRHAGARSVVPGRRHLRALRSAPTSSSTPTATTSTPRTGSRTSSDRSSPERADIVIADRQVHLVEHFSPVKVRLQTLWAAASSTGRPARPCPTPPAASGPTRARA